MKLESQVTSLEISKRLKELGVPQKSVAYWIKYSLADKERIYYLGELDIEQFSTLSGKRELHYSAFTVAELGEMLPIRVQSGKRKKPRNKFYCNWDKKSGVYHREDADTEADARGKMLIYLLENGLIANQQTQ